MSRQLIKFYKNNVKTRTSRWIVEDQVNTQYDQLHPKLPFNIRNKKYKIKSRIDNSVGGQLAALTTPMTNLIRDERVLLNVNRATELRGYVDRLIVEAMRNGDCHRPTMDLANFWLHEKNLIHKLFKVLVPRYIDYTTSFTAIHKLGMNYEKSLVFDTRGQDIWWRGGECVLELRGNFLPKIIRPRLNKHNLLSNVLIRSTAENRPLPKFLPVVEREQKTND